MLEVGERDKGAAARLSTVGAVTALRTEPLAPTEPDAPTVARAPRDWPRQVLGIAVALALLLAFAQSLRSVLGAVPIGVALRTAAVLGTAIALAGVTIWRRRLRPAIHDRQLDWLVAVPLLGAGCLILLVLPHQMSTRFWETRVDLLALPMVVAGFVVLFLGSRVAWDLKFPILLLVLLWPPIWRGPLFLVCLITLIALAGVAARNALQPRAAEASGSSFARVWLNEWTVAVAALVITVVGGADIGFSRYHALLDGEGSPRITALGDQAVRAAGFGPRVVVEHDVITRIFGDGVAWSTSRLAGGRPGGLDVLTSSARGRLSKYAVRSGGMTPRSIVGERGQVRLPYGVVASTMTYRERASRQRWVSVQADLPVAGARGTEVQRFIVQLPTRRVDERQTLRAGIALAARIVAGAGADAKEARG